MKSIVVGGGAMGSIFAAGLAQAGEDVVVLDSAAGLVDSINARGVSLETSEGKVVTRLSATTDPSCLGTADLVLVFVKAHHTAAVGTALENHVGQGTVVATLQNGWGNADTLAQSVAAEHLVMGVTYHSGTVISPASVAHTGRGPTFVGPYVAEGDPTLAGNVASTLMSAGFEATAAPDVRTEILEQTGPQRGHLAGLGHDGVAGGRDVGVAGGRRLGGSPGGRGVSGGGKDRAQCRPGRTVGKDQGRFGRSGPGQTVHAPGCGGPPQD